MSQNFTGFQNLLWISVILGGKTLSQGLKGPFGWRHTFRCRYYRPTGESDSTTVFFKTRSVALLYLSMLYQLVLFWPSNPLSLCRRRYSCILGLTKNGVLDFRRPIANNVKAFDRISECANWITSLGLVTNDYYPNRLCNNKFWMLLNVVYVCLCFYHSISYWNPCTSNGFGFTWAHVSLRMDRYATRAEELAARLVPEEFLGESQDGWRFADLFLLYLNLNDCWKGNPES